MGSSMSSASRERERTTLIPRIVYMVFGDPSIRYVHSRQTGPLIFDVHMDTEEGEADVQHAETLRLPTAIPAKQTFTLAPCNPGTNRAGYQLHFSLAADEVNESDNEELQVESIDGNATLPPQQPRLRYPKYVSVYAGVRVQYVPGKGISLQQDSKSQPTPVVLDRDAFDGVRLQTTEPILLHKLCAASYVAEEEPADGNPIAPSSKIKRILTAPLCIVARVACDGAPKESGRDEDIEEGHEEGEGEAGGEEGGTIFEQARGEQDLDGESTHASERAPSDRGKSRKRGAAQSRTHSTFDVLLYTFLDFPQDAYELRDVPTIAAAASASPDGAPTAAGNTLRYKGHVVKQLMQVGVEVYELENVFDLGTTDDADLDGDGEDNEDRELCVICLTNPKDTTILPCRHMCLCYECAAQLRLSTNACPLCRCSIERVINI